MPKIITITFNPCIDKSTTVDALIPEKKLRCTTPKFDPGGGGINVARAIKKLGGEATAIYPYGGYSGLFLNKLLEQEGIVTQVVETKSHTRENLIVLEEKSNNQFRFGMPGSALQEQEWQQLLQLVANAKDVEYVVASGSLSPGVPVDVFARLAAIAKQKQMKLVVDTSGEALKKAVAEGVYLLKPNLGELSALTGREHLSAGEIETAAKELIEGKCCTLVVVSMGADGAMLVTKEESVHMQAPAVERKSTVGAGDSMVAGIVLSLANNKSYREALQFGIACGTAATVNPGTELSHLEDVLQLYPQVQILTGQ